MLLFLHKTRRHLCVFFMISDQTIRDAESRGSFYITAEEEAVSHKALNVWTHVHTSAHIDMSTHTYTTWDRPLVHTHTPSSVHRRRMRGENCKYWATPCPWKMKYNRWRQFTPLLLFFFLWTNMLVVVASILLNKYPILPERQPSPCCLREPGSPPAPGSPNRP